MPGPKGDPGSANVLYSDWFKPVQAGSGGFSSFRAALTSSNCSRAYLLNMNQVLAGRLNTSVILLYFKESIPQLNPDIGPLPYVDGWSGKFYTFLIDPQGIDGIEMMVSFRVTASDETLCKTDVATRLDQTMQIRYVIVPGAQLLNPQSLNPASSLHTLPYREIQQRFGIPD